MTMKSRSPYVARLSAAAFGVAALFAVTAAEAQCTSCRPDYEPGLLAYLSAKFSKPSAPADCAQCAYRGDYMVNQGPVFSGPAVIAPQHTYAPTPTASGYPNVSARAQYEAVPNQVEGEVAPASPIYRPAPSRRYVQLHEPRSRPVMRRRVVQVKHDAPPAKGKPQIIRARAEVKIYGPQRMDIRLFRR
jgi:hypothetical protein